MPPLHLIVAVLHHPRHRPAALVADPLRLHGGLGPLRAQPGLVDVQPGFGRRTDHVQMLAVQQHLPLPCVSQSELGQMLRQFLNGFPLLLQFLNEGDIIGMLSGIFICLEMVYFKNDELKKGKGESTLGFWGVQF